MQAVLGEGWVKEEKPERQRDREKAQGRAMGAGGGTRQPEMGGTLELYWRGKSTAQGL